MSEWPELPAPGELVRLPLALPPTLIAAAGYRASGRYLALFWTPDGDELMFCDGAVTSTGFWPAWTTLAHHQLGRVILGPYELGSSETRAVHWLLADRHTATLDVGAERDVRQFLATQPSELSAAVQILGAERVRELILEQLQHTRTPTIEEVHRQLRESHQLVSELGAWLDAVLAQTLNQ